jgi:phosphoenolpyruvate carboxykinase (ATP)
MLRFAFVQMKQSGINLNGLTDTGPVRRNLPVAELVETSLRRGEGTLASNGALVALTGKRTGRSPSDKFVVREPSSEGRIWWGKVNQPMDREQFRRLHARVVEHFKGREVFVFDGFAGADPAHRLPVRIITEQAWHSLFARQLFRRPRLEELEGHRPEFTVIAAPTCLADAAGHGTKSEAFIALDFGAGLTLIGGTHYAGEVKKAIFTAMNYLMPLQGVFPMHCSANVGPGGDVALFFGLSGTGKTSLSADSERGLIGDDEHGWGDNGVFNFEGGCYAKCIRLSREREPQIWDAIRFGSVVENVVVNAATREVDYRDDSITENTRAAYPLEFIANAVETGMAGHPGAIVFLAADAFGILPPVARLTETQAMYHFLSGYTARLAGTEAGMGREPEATFSTCFGAPFLPLPPRVYADMLAKKMREHRCRCYLVNTGWVGGPHGVGERIRLHYNRVTIHEILSGRLDHAPTVRDPVFGFEVPQQCGEVPVELLRLRHSWGDPTAYDAQARELARRFVKNFEQYANAAPDIASAGPKV